MTDRRDGTVAGAAAQGVANGFFGAAGCLGFVALAALALFGGLVWRSANDCSLDDPRCVDATLRKAYGIPPAAAPGPAPPVRLVPPPPRKPPPPEKARRKGELDRVVDRWADPPPR